MPRKVFPAPGVPLSTRPADKGGNFSLDRGIRCFRRPCLNLSFVYDYVPTLEKVIATEYASLHKIALVVTAFRLCTVGSPLDVRYYEQIVRQPLTAKGAL